MSEDPYKLLREWVDPEAGGTLPQMYRLQILDLFRDLDEMRSNYEHACLTVAQMHEAAMGEVTGPNKGVVEDVLDLRLYAEHLKSEIDGLAKVLMAEFGGPTAADVDNGACGMAVRLLREFRSERDRLRLKLKAVDDAADDPHAHADPLSLARAIRAALASGEESRAEEPGR